MKKQAIIYSRVSSKRQVTEGHGNDSQEQRCKQYAEFKGYEVIKTFRDEGVSGGIIDRPGMRNLLEFLDGRKGDQVVVVFDDIKRLARDIEGHFTLKTSICTRNAVIESPSMRFEDSPEGKFVETVLAGAAELERNQNKKQVRNRMQARLEAGYWCFDYPPGYKYEKVEGHGKLLVPDEPKASLVKEAIEGFASGRFQSQLEVQVFLQKNDFTHRGMPGVVHFEQVRRILAHVLYSGHVEYTPWEVNRRKGHHKGLVDLETFERVQERLNETRHAPNRRGINDDFPLRGFVSCSECRQVLTAGWTKGRSDKYPYYRCKTKGCNMRNKNIKRADIEAKFETLLCSLEPSPKVLAVVEHELKVLWGERITDIERIRKDREQKIADVDTDIKSCIDKIMITNSPIVIRELENKVEKLEEQKLRLGESDQNKEKNYDFDDALHRVLSFLSEPLKRWNEGDLRQKRLVLRMMFDESLIYNRDEGFYTSQKDLVLTHPMRICCIPELNLKEGKPLVEMPGVEPGCYVLK